MTNQVKKKKKKPNTLRILKAILPLAIALFAIAITLYFMNFDIYVKNTDECDRRSMWGTFGDFMGGTLNPLFALLSLYAIITTIIIQTKELKMSRKELKATRKELKRSGKAQEEQSESFKHQNISIKLQTFENTFFKLLENHNILNPKFYTRMDEHNIPTRLLKNTELTVADAFKEINYGVTKNYFMSLYQVLKFVKEQEKYFIDIPSFEPKLYTNIIRATFDDAILILLSINCVIPGFEKYKELVENYSIFEHLDIEFIREITYDINRNPVKYDTFTPRILEILEQYRPIAFGNNEGLKSIIKTFPKDKIT